MIRASGLYGRSVIDLDTAERVGEIDEIIVDPYGPGIAGYVVACDRPIFRSRKRIIIPVDAVHAIGPDAVTTRGVGATDYHTAHLDALPRLSELTGRRMVSFGGHYLGSVEDALVSERDGRIIGYPLERSGPGTWFESAFGLGWRAERPDYVRADAALRIGARLIVVPDDAITPGSELEEAAIEDLPNVDRPALASAPADVGMKQPGPGLQDEGPPPTAAAIRESQARTSPFAMDDLQVTDEGLGMEPSAASDWDNDYGPPAVDPEQDTVVLAATGTERGRSRRRPQAEKMR
jgi:sporulation protein YlmC with PRC-barrel domain